MGKHIFTKNYVFPRLAVSRDILHCYGDKSYSCLVGIGLQSFKKSQFMDIPSTACERT